MAPACLAAVEKKVSCCKLTDKYHLSEAVCLQGLDYRGTCRHPRPERNRDIEAQLIDARGQARQEHLEAQQQIKQLEKKLLALQSEKQETPQRTSSGNQESEDADQRSLLP